MFVAFKCFKSLIYITIILCPFSTIFLSVDLNINPCIRRGMFLKYYSKLFVNEIRPTILLKIISKNVLSFDFTFWVLFIIIYFIILWLQYTYFLKTFFLKHIVFIVHFSLACEAQNNYKSM